MYEFDEKVSEMRSPTAAVEGCTQLRRLRVGSRLAIPAVATLMVSLGALGVSAASDIRAHEKEGVRELVRSDVLRSSQVVDDQGQLIVGVAFFEITPRAQRRLAETAFEFLSRSTSLDRGMVLIDGRSGRIFAKYDPEKGLQAR